MRKTFIQAMLDMDDIPLLGEDKNGFRYYEYDGYIYQQYPECDYWVTGENKKDCFNGVYCSLPSWERTMSKHIMTGKEEV